MSQKLIIVGGVAGGATAAARLRRISEDVEIVLIERGNIYHLLIADCLITLEKQSKTEANY